MKTRFASYGGLSASNQTLVHCAANQRITIDSMYHCNPHSGNITFELYHVPAGSDPGVGNALFNGSVNSGKTTSYTAPIYMEPGDRIVAVAGTAGHIIITLYADVRTIGEA